MADGVIPGNVVIARTLAIWRTYRINNKNDEKLTDEPDAQRTAAHKSAANLTVSIIAVPGI